MQWGTNFKKSLLPFKNYISKKAQDPIVHRAKRSSYKIRVERPVVLIFFQVFFLWHVRGMCIWCKSRKRDFTNCLPEICSTPRIPYITDSWRGLNTSRPPELGSCDELIESIVSQVVSGKDTAIIFRWEFIFVRHYWTCVVHEWNVIVVVFLQMLFFFKKTA